MISLSALSRPVFTGAASLLLSLALNLLCAANANAASVSITGPTDVIIGDTFELQLFGDFSSEGLIAGGITIAWDAALVQLDGITLALPVDSDFSCPGSINCPPNGANSAPIVWGEFLSDLIAASDPAPTLMATLTFTAIDGTGGVAQFTMQDNLDLAGGWFSSGPIATPTFSNASVNIIPVNGGSFEVPAVGMWGMVILVAGFVFTTVLTRRKKL